MRLRSLLFVPGDRPERMKTALQRGADALIIDLEDAVALQSKPMAREMTAAFLRSAKRQAKLFVRVNALDSGLLDGDLAAVVAAGPDALVLPKAEGAASVQALSARAPGIPILPIATETPSAIFEIGSYRAVGNLIGWASYAALRDGAIADAVCSPCRRRRSHRHNLSGFWRSERGFRLCGTRPKRRLHRHDGGASDTGLRHQ